MIENIIEEEEIESMVVDKVIHSPRQNDNGLSADNMDLSPPEPKRSRALDQAELGSKLYKSSNLLTAIDVKPPMSTLSVEDRNRRSERELRAAAAERRLMGRICEGKKVEEEKPAAGLINVEKPAPQLPVDELEAASSHQNARVQSRETQHGVLGMKLGQFLTESEANRLSSVVYGKHISEEVFSQWSRQGFRFSDHQETLWGLVQSEGGPCGILAPIQALVLKHLLFGSENESDNMQDTSAPSCIPQFDDETRKRALVRALAQTLWVAGQGKRASVAVVDSQGIQSALKKQQAVGSDVTLNEEVSKMTLQNGPSLQALLRVTHCDSLPALESCISESLPLFQSRLGALLLLFSALLSRTLDGVEEDRDDPSEPLITHPFGHASQEVVNLLLSGHAVTHVFDGRKDLEGGLKLKGIPGPVEVGFLTMMEYLRYCEVGSFLKKPKWPVWVVGSESHYTVLFALSASMVEEKEPRETQEARVRAYFDELDSSGGGGFISRDSCSQLLSNLGIDLPDETKSSLMAGEYIVWNELYDSLMVLDASRGGLKGMKSAETLSRFDLFHFNGLAKFDVGQQIEGSGEAGMRDMSTQRPRLTKLSLTLPPKWTPQTAIVEYRVPALNLNEGMDSTADSWRGSTREGTQALSKHAPLVDCIRTKWPTATCTWEGDAPSVV